MKGFFNYDGYLSRILTGVMYIVSLNLLFLLCSIPIITIGAANTAMYTVLFRYLKNDEPDIIKSFFRAFIQNFKKATIVWMLMLITLGTLLLNFYFIYQWQMSFAGIIRIVFNIVLVIWAVIWIYIFPAMSYFYNDVKGYMTFAVGLALVKLPYTLVLILLQTVPVLTVLFLAQYMPMAVLLLICGGISLPAYYSGKLLLRLFKNYEGSSDEET